MSQWPGIGERIKATLVKKGYFKNGRPDISGFALDHRWVPATIYRWCNSDVLPERENLLKLAEQLGVSAQWLLFGGEPPPSPAKKRRPVPISGGSGAAAPLPVGAQVTEMSLIRRNGWAQSLRNWMATLGTPLAPRMVFA